MQVLHILRLAIRYISYIVTAVVALLYLTAAAAPLVPPLRWAIPAFFGLFFPIFLSAQILATLYWLLRFRWQMILIEIIVFALSWSSLTAFFPINRDANKERLVEEVEQRPLKVLSYNVGGFGLSHHSASKPNRALLYIKSSEADIVCLQEAVLSSSSDWGVTLSQIKAYLGHLYPHIEYKQAQHGGSNLMIFSRFPIKSVERLQISSHSNGAVAFTLDMEGKTTTVLNLHLESFRLPNSAGTDYAKLVKEGNAMQLKDILSMKFTPVFERHNVQANVIHEYIKRLDSQRVIVCGDFNDTPVSYTLGKIGEGLTNAYSEAGNGLGWSYRSRFFKVRIDHILVGKAFTPLFTEVDASVRGSDHYPIYTYLRERAESPLAE